ncbi:hypothetical protein [Rhodococcus jostii]|uniref:DUF7341 domain-containing protein n=1 Tax=Rhodococcus jostii TaxID=132919 RepID=UPI003628736D
MNADAEGTYLPGALQNLDDAIQGLTAPHTRLHRAGSASQIITKPSVYAEMIESVQGAQGSALGGVARSMPPIWVDGVDWISKVDNAVKEWWPARTDTLGRLEQMVAAAWRPQDTEFIDHAATSIMKWTREAETLLNGGREQFSTCGERWVYRKDTLGENVRTPALTVTSMGCSCRACAHHWGVEYFDHLARVIGAVGDVVTDER